MNGRNFDEIVSNLKSSIAGYDYYVNFSKVINNVDTLKVELNILNSLVGSKNIEDDFASIIRNYPKTLIAIPMLLAVRNSEIKIYDKELIVYDFYNKNLSNEMYLKLMRNTGLFDLLETSKIKSLIDYVTGVEVGLDSNARKNRTGHLMEDIVEDFIKETNYIEYHKEMNKKAINESYSVNIDELINETAKEFIASKRFDFVVKTNRKLYLIETNFYSSQGSKLNETARSFKSLGKDIDRLNEIEFIWITDGIGWLGAKSNLKETFEVVNHLYTLTDLEHGVLKKVIQ